jgi:hypothetical protein
MGAHDCRHGGGRRALGQARRRSAGLGHRQGEKERGAAGDRRERDEAGVEAGRLDHEARHEVAQAGPHAGRRGESPLRQVEPAGTLREVSDDPHRHDPEDPRADAVEELHADEVIARDHRRSEAKDLLDRAGNDLAARGREIIARAGVFGY